MPGRYSPKLKFQVVLELLKGDKKPNQVARAYGVHPNSAGLWKMKYYNGKRRHSSLGYMPPMSYIERALSKGHGR